MSVPWSEKVYQISNHDKYLAGVFFVPLFVWRGQPASQRNLSFSVFVDRKMCLLAPSSSIILCP